VSKFDPDHRFKRAESGGLLKITIQAPNSFQQIPALAVRDSCAIRRLRAQDPPRTRGPTTQAQDHHASLLSAVHRKTFKAGSQSKPERYVGPMPPSRLAICWMGWMGPFHRRPEWLQPD